MYYENFEKNKLFGLYISKFMSAQQLIKYFAAHKMDKTTDN